MNETEELSITKGEYNALNFIDGLESSVFNMVVQARQNANGRYTLSGPSSVFDVLQHDIFDEIDAELSPPSRLKHLRKLYLRLVPESDEI